MSDKQIITLIETVTGLMATQTLLYHLLTKEGIIKREDVGLVLDSLINKFNTQYPGGNVTRPIEHVRAAINKADPLQYPDWLRDIIDE